LENLWINSTIVTVILKAEEMDIRKNAPHYGWYDE